MYVCVSLCKGKRHSDAPWSTRTALYLHLPNCGHVCLPPVSIVRILLLSQSRLSFPYLVASYTGSS